MGFISGFDTDNRLYFQNETLFLCKLTYPNDAPEGIRSGQNREVPCSDLHHLNGTGSPNEEKRVAEVSNIADSIDGLLAHGKKLLENAKNNTHTGHSDWCKEGGGFQPPPGASYETDSNDYSTYTKDSLSQGVYNYSVIDANGCFYSDFVIINEPTSLETNPVISNVVCNGQSNGTIVLNTSGGTLPYTENFGGYKDNTEIAKAMATLLGFQLSNQSGKK